jgi:hypothetical protein
MALTKATNRMTNGAVVNVLDYGAVGDGVTDDTVAIQAAVNTGKTVYIPEAPVNYLVSTITLLDEQTIYGDGKYAQGLLGDGTGPVIQCGNAVDVTDRQNSIKELRISNPNAGECVNVKNSPNFHINGCVLGSTGANAITLNFSWRATIKDCSISCSGAYNAIDALDNVNGLIIDGCTITGGSAGRAIRIGMCQGVRVSNNIIESSLNGIWVASTSDTGDGNCNGVTIWNNYIEQSSTPIVLSKVFSVLGGVVKGNYIGNTNTSSFTTRTAAITHGRLRGVEITDNSIFLESGGSEDLLNVYIEAATGDIENVLFARNYVQNTPANNIQKFGTYASNSSVNSGIGAESIYDFGFNQKTMGPETYISPRIYANQAYTDNEFVNSDDWVFGGRIDSVQIIDAEGTLTGAQLSVGDSAGPNTNVNLTTLTALTFTRGVADCTVAVSTMSGPYNRWRVTAGTGTGSYRIKIVYRAT